MLETSFHTLQKLYDVNIAQFLLIIHIATHLTNMKVKKLTWKKKFNMEIIRSKLYIGSTNKTDYIPSYIKFPIVIVRYISAIRFLIPEP